MQKYTLLPWPNTQKEIGSNSRGTKALVDKTVAWDVQFQTNQTYHWKTYHQKVLEFSFFMLFLIYSTPLLKLCNLDNDSMFDFKNTQTISDKNQTF